MDRGAHSLETICLLLALKIEHPTHVHLIRGNHEVRLEPADSQTTANILAEAKMGVMWVSPAAPAMDDWITPTIVCGL